MVHFRIELKSISRGQGRSVIAAAAYRHGAVLEDRRQQITHDYARKSAVAHSEIIAPADAPAWARDRSELWNRADAAEKRRDAITAREVLVSLPRELGRDQHLELLRNFVEREFTSRNIVADIAVHEASALDGGAQPHAHIMLVDRPIGADGFGPKKDRRLATADGVEAVRSAWAEEVNQALERARIASRVDHRSLKRQRIAAARTVNDETKPDRERRQALWTWEATNRAPEPKIGPVAMKMARQGRGPQALALRDALLVRQVRNQVLALVAQMRAVAREILSIQQEILGNSLGQAASVAAATPASRMDDFSALAKAQAEKLRAQQSDAKPAETPKPAQPTTGRPLPKPRRRDTGWER